MVQAEIRTSLIEQVIQMESYIYNIAYKVVQNKDIADDIVQDVYVKILKNGNTYTQERGPLRNWISRVAYNDAIDTRRKHAGIHRRECSIEEEYVYDYIREDSSSNPLKIIAACEEQENLHSLIDRCGQLGKEMIHLRYILRLEYKEISSLLGIPLGTVKSRINSVKNRLKNFLCQDCRC